MKKFLVVLLALAMILGLATTAMAADTQIQDYSDTTTSTEYAADIYRLTALGVLCGDTGWGNAYRPTDNITRAEFAKIVCYLAGKQGYKDYYKAQQSAFSDVAEGHWAKGFINCCNANGLMVGVGGGKFAPEANVTKQEVAAAVLRAVGYDGKHLPYNWPNNYIAKSQKVHTIFEEVFKDDLSLYQYVEKIDGTAATRAEMAAIVNYCLDLYRVEYVGDKTVVVGLSNVDSDGFAYMQADTNEPGYGDYTTLLWDVFKAYVVPTWQFEAWYDSQNTDQFDQYVEASGWGYEDFEKGELIFLENDPDYDTDPVAVASDYYIFDQYLDGELWQLGNRYAFLTIKLNGKVLTGDYEALFVELLTDVNYYKDEHKTGIKENGVNVKVANADVFSGDWNDNDDYAIYDYDDFAEEDIAIVTDVDAKEKLVTVDYANFGEGGKFCYLPDCDTHDQEYVFLKDGKLQDASCLKVDDVIYWAGNLAENQIDLYIVYTPVAGKLGNLPTGGADGHRIAQISGTAYKFCPNDYAHAVSYNGGYASDGGYGPIYYNEVKEHTGEDCLYAIGYGKTYIATLIFAAEANNYNYGVLTDFTDNYSGVTGRTTAVDATIFGPDGNEPTYKFDEAIVLGGPYAPYALRSLGSLGNFWLDEDGKIITDPASGKRFGTAGANDLGYVQLRPVFGYNAWAANTELKFNDHGRINNVNAADTLSYKSNTFQDMEITADTVIFEVTYKNGAFDSVKIGDTAKYLSGKSFTAQQLEIFAWDGFKVKVLYVVNPHFYGDILMGVFEVSYYGENGYEIVFEDGTVLNYDGTDWPYNFQINDTKRYYGIYRTDNTKVDTLVYGNGAWDFSVDPGDLIILFDEYGAAIPTTSVNALITANTDATVVYFDRTFAQVETNDIYEDTTEFIDLTGDGSFDKSFFTGAHGTADTDKYLFAIANNADGENLQIFRYFAPAGL